MKKFNKLITFLLLFSLIFSTSTTVFASQSSLNDDESIKQTLNDYFKVYFKSLETLNQPNYSNVVEKNSNTVIYTTANELQVEQYKLINLSYKNTKFKLDFDNLHIDNSNAQVNIKMNCDYNYSSTPDAKSTISNIKYSFELKKNLSGKWLITMIDSNFDQFNSFKEAAQQNKSRSKRDLTSTNNLESVKQELLNNAKTTVKNLGGAPTADKTPKETDSNKRMKRSASYPYESYKGLFYAQVHAQNRNTYFKYVDGNDCTNFVSQCIWYSYGGVNEGIKSQSRMVSGGINDGWFASANGVSTPWSSVEKLWNRIVTNYPGNGPNGTGYNNNQPYYNFAPGRIYAGEVLQFKNLSRGDTEYKHSVYVTKSNNGSNKYYNEILVSQHSSDWYNRNLYDLILSYGGNSCHMRDISLTSAYLN